jgi:hypothetical protein
MKLIIFLSLILAAILSRFVPHIPNAVPITAIAIFAGANLPKKYALTVPLLVRLISDLFIGFFSWPLMVAVYVAHLLGAGFGLWIKNSSAWQSRWLKIFSAPLFTAIIFFLITNFAFLYSNYPHNWAGIMLSYTNGLPFLRGTVIGDFGYSVALFGSFELVKYLASLGGKFFAVNKVVNREH